ncbi:fatty acid synthase-like [Battus philenor]|uniref:fatty acid synthase-like n=1 Tax=Battus philenor TaxID=42288 RepID=UPI0035CF2137
MVLNVLLAYQTGQVAGNLHYKNPREDVAAVRDRRIQVVSENQPLNRSYVAVNNLSLNGINAHLLLNCEYRPKQIENYVSSIPHLVLASGRQESAVEFIFNYLKSRLINPEELALLHHIHEKRINGHLSRGYTVLGTEDDKTVCLGEKVERFDGLKRPVWFVYSGLGSQWTGMGGQLMRIPRFAATIQRIHEVLEPRGVDIVDIITTTDKSAVRGIFNALLGITSIQIALTDVLADLGIVPDNIIGHSIGELGCGYADGCLTLEEMILSAYYRGRVAEEIPVIKGAMCAVGLGYQKMRDMCPPGIYISCRNGPDSCTLSGPVEDIEKFSKKLEAEGIFVKTVASDDIAFHSPYIAAYNEIHKAYLREVITPRERSARWITSSVPAERAHEYTGRYSCAEYHNNNMMSAVLFEEALQHVPANAILIEIAPHGLLQAILKRSVPSGCCNVPLTQRGHPDNVLFFLKAIGQ